MAITDIVQIRDLRFKLILTPEEIAKRIKQIAQILNENFENQEVVAVSVLNGAFIFTADLLRELRFSVDCRFLRIQSYAGTRSSGTVHVANPEVLDLEDKHVVIVEDIVDTGRTMHQICEIVRQKKVKSLTVVTFLHKPDAMVVSAQIDYVAFVIENEFVVGYGLDYDGLGRQLPALYQLVND